jgi:hypothetical protein
VFDAVPQMSLCLIQSLNQFANVRLDSGSEPDEQDKEQRGAEDSSNNDVSP